MNTTISKLATRPKKLKLTLQLVQTVLISLALVLAFYTMNVTAAESAEQSANDTKPKAFVYTELQISVSSFNDIPWQKVNDNIKQQPGFINKTWLYGVGNHSGGGFYAFDSIENAQKFVTEYFPEEAKGFGVAQTSRIFDADVTEEASRDMSSAHYIGNTERKPGAYVYTEVQVQVVPFNEGPWREINPTLKQQPGLLSKTWLSGFNTGTPGGLYAFDTIENAQKFVLEYYPTAAKSFNAAFYTRVFDANATEAASGAMNSPFYSN